MRKCFCLMICALLLISTIVSYADEVKVKSISFDDKTIQIAEGCTFIPSYSLLPKDANELLTWRSSNPNVAAVDEYGVITGIKTGKCQLLVYTEGGKRKKAQVNIQVDEYDLVFMNNTAQQTGFLYNSGNYIVTWKSKNGCVRAENIPADMFAVVAGGPGLQQFDVIPVKVGPDILTVQAGRTKTEIKIYVSQNAFLGYNDANGYDQLPEKYEIKKQKVEMASDEIVGDGEIILDWSKFNVSLIGVLDSYSEDGTEGKQLRIECYINGVPNWGFTESAACDKDDLMFHAFMGGKEEEPNLFIYNIQDGLTAIDLIDGMKIWNIPGGRYPMGNAAVHISDPESGFVYICGTDSSAVISIDTNGAVLWCTELNISEDTTISELVLQDNGIEIRLENETVITLDYNGGLKNR